MADKDETQDPEYNEKVEHEGWKDIREKPRWCTDIFFLVNKYYECSYRAFTTILDFNHCCLVCDDHCRILCFGMDR